MLRFLIFLIIFVSVLSFHSITPLRKSKSPTFQRRYVSFPKFDDAVVKSTLGAPSQKPMETSFTTESSIKVFTEVTSIQNHEEELQNLVDALDRTYGKRSIWYFQITILSSILLCCRCIIVIFV